MTTINQKKLISYNSVLKKKSQSTIPAATETFKECFVPTWGISTTSSETFIISSETPSTSFPNIKAYFVPLTGLNFSIFRDSSACSIEIILTSFFFNFLIVSII